jgi:stearoyl-CoA desaturase (delta-9 desaturase)
LLVFSWAGVVVCAALYGCTLWFGLTLGYHRLFTHRSFSAPRALRILLAGLGCLALEGGPIRWAKTHRLHHRFADTEHDPHSPKVSFWWSQIGWMLFWQGALRESPESAKVVPDLLADPDLRWFERHFMLVNVAVAASLFGLGTFLWGFRAGLSLVLWGVALRAVLVWHASWLVNSAIHLWGHRRYPTRDTSRNLWWVALLTFGEGWHNNHHAAPGLAAHGRGWKQPDPTYWLILILEKIGVASDVKRK